MEAIADISYLRELTPTAARKFGTNFRSVLLSGKRYYYTPLPPRKMHQNSLR